MDERCKAIWEKLSAALKPQVSADTFKRWFSAVELTKATEDELTFVVPNNIYQFWIESNHMTALQSAITDAVGAPRTVRFLTSAESDGDDDFTAPEVRKTDGSSHSKTIPVWGSVSIRETPLNHSSSGQTTRSRTPPVWPWRKRPRAPTTRSSFMAASGWAKRI